MLSILKNWVKINCSCLVGVLNRKNWLISTIKIAERAKRGSGWWRAFFRAREVGITKANREFFTVLQSKVTFFSFKGKKLNLNDKVAIFLEQMWSNVLVNNYWIFMCLSKIGARARIFSRIWRFDCDHEIYLTTMVLIHFSFAGTEVWIINSHRWYSEHGFRPVLASSIHLRNCSYWISRLEREHRSIMAPSPKHSCRGGGCPPKRR